MQRIEQEQQRRRMLEIEKNQKQVDLIFNIQTKLWKMDYKNKHHCENTMVFDSSVINKLCNEHHLSQDYSDKLCHWIIDLELSEYEEEERCGICYEKDNLSSISCNHTFCAKCLNAWNLVCKNTTKCITCPCCRTNISFVIIDSNTPISMCDTFTDSWNVNWKNNNKMMNYHVYLLDDVLNKKNLPQLIICDSFITFWVWAEGNLSGSP